MIKNQIKFIAKKQYLFTLLLVFSNILVNGQNLDDKSSFKLTAKDSLDRVYGMDPLLYNGMLYKHFYPRSILGHQYLSETDYLKGDATIRGIKFKNLDLNYDIYNQEVLLKYLSSSNVYEIIMISKAWLEDFSFGTMRFVYFNTPSTPKRIYQVIGNNSVRLLYYWKKDLKIDNIIGNTHYYFLPSKELNVLIDNSIKNFHNNRSFVNLFSKDKQVIIKKYLRQNKIKVKKASDQTMEDFINYCSKL